MFLWQEKMNSEEMISLIIEALKNVNSLRFFRTERGYQGRFACALYKILDGKRIFPDDAIIEEEYQKNYTSHGTRQRPDLIIHVPFEAGRSGTRSENNFVVFAFKKDANEKKAKGDFEKLDALFDKLKYPLGIFINVSERQGIFLDKYTGTNKNRIHEFCVKLVDDKVNILHAYFKKDQIINENL